MWDTIIIRPIINLLLLFYKFLGHETIVAVALLTLLMRLLVTPLMLKQQKSTRQQQELHPKLIELQKKYKDDPQKLMEEQRKLGINPMGGCLPLLIQLPLMIGLYQGIMRVLASTPLQLLALPRDIYRWIPSFSSLIPLKSRFLWLDLALPDSLFILPLLVVVTSWFYQKLITPPAMDPQAEAMNKQMMLMMPLMTGFFSATYASGLAIYFLITNLIGILQYYLFRQYYTYPTPPASDKKPPAQKRPQASTK
ncbi:MAG TPA: YidC/Oxa1 family membrane protein insertase [Anaerolineae bacterium]|nr:YidC/Oxa1 family membrane protein insertase [Anaerolineae bacterium]HQH38404.1 YidC/Oxa1 family membrane protein insertase [Anaerolineae bacterium]